MRAVWLIWPLLQIIQDLIHDSSKVYRFSLAVRVRFKPMIEIASLDEDLAFLDLHGRKWIFLFVNPFTDFALRHACVPLDGFQVHPLGVEFEFLLLGDHDNFTLACCDR
jgi:hypothetical protein